MASHDEPRRPRRRKGQYDPILPADIPDSAPAAERQRLVGTTDPSVVRKKRLVPQVPDDRQRRSRTPLTLPPPARARTGRAATDGGPSGVSPPPERRRLSPPTTPRERPTRSPVRLPTPPKPHRHQRDGGPDAPEPAERRPLIVPPPARSPGDGDFLPRKRVIPVAVSGGRAAGSTGEVPPRSVRGAGVRTLPSLSPPSQPDYDVPEVRGFEERGITGVTTGHSYFHGGE